MTRTIFCTKLHKEAKGIDMAPYPNKLGQRIFDEISQEAWEQWLNHQTMLINEYKLSMIDPKSKKFLLEEMEKFLFGEGTSLPPGYQPPETNQDN